MSTFVDRYDLGYRCTSQPLSLRLAELTSALFTVNFTAIVGFFFSRSHDIDGDQHLAKPLRS